MKTPGHCALCNQDVDDIIAHMDTVHADISMDERFRYCIYCGADCWLEPENQEHGKECPCSTGLWPVMARDLVPHGMQCMGCGTEFNAGDIYVLRDTDTGKMVTRPGGGSVNDVLCIGCGALEGLVKGG